MSYDRLGFPVPTPVPQVRNATILVVPQQWLFARTFGLLVLLLFLGLVVFQSSASVPEGLTILAGVAVVVGIRPLV